MIKKQRHWVPYELKSRDAERRFVTCERLLQRQKRKGFLHRLVTDDEKWTHYDNPKRRQSWDKPGHASTPSAKPNNHGSKLLLCIWWDQQSVIYYELLKTNEGSLSTSIDNYNNSSNVKGRRRKEIFRSKYPHE